jgi:predicted dehydrogenase
MKLRVGIIGLGDAWEKSHRPALRALSDRFEVRAICAEVAHLAQQAARDFRADEVSGFRALCQRDDVEAVLLFSPEWYGPLPIYAAAEAGKAVYCASAFDLEPQQADDVRQRVEAAGVAFLAEFPRRLAPATVRLKELIATRLGKPRLLFCHRRAAVGVSKIKNQRKQPNEAGATLREMVELVDWCRYVVGSEATSVIGVTHHAPDGASDYRMMNLDFSEPGKLGEGPTAQISSGHYIPGHWAEAASFRPPAALQVACERGIAFIDLPSALTWFDEAGRHMESLESERPVGEALLLQFHRAVTSLVLRTADLEDTYRALRIVQAAERCATEGRRIFLNGAGVESTGTESAVAGAEQPTILRKRVS